MFIVKGLGCLLFLSLLRLSAKGREQKFRFETGDGRFTLGIGPKRDCRQPKYPLIGIY